MEEHLKGVYQKAASFCAYQERTHDEVRQKLAKLYVLPEDSEVIIARLIEENYLNEERFAKTYAGSKFRLKHWGRKRIELELRRRNLSEYCIRSAMKEIDNTDYKAALLKLASKKWEAIQTKKEHFLVKKQKLVSFLMQKGYESSVIREVTDKVCV